MDGTGSTHDDEDECIQDFGAETKRKDTTSRKWEDIYKMDLTEIGWYGMDLINLAHDTDQWRNLVNTAMNFRVP